MNAYNKIKNVNVLKVQGNTIKTAQYKMIKSVKSVENVN